MIVRNDRIQSIWSCRKTNYPRPFKPAPILHREPIRQGEERKEFEWKGKKAMILKDKLDPESDCFAGLAVEGDGVALLSAVQGSNSFTASSVVQCLGVFSFSLHVCLCVNGQRRVFFLFAL